MTWTTDADWVTRKLALTATGDGWERSLVLERDESGWNGGRFGEGFGALSGRGVVPMNVVEPVDVPAAVLDVDVRWSPVTNLMPVRRLGLDRVGSAGVSRVAWVSVPSLAVTLEEQHYTLLGDDNGEVCARFENADGFFTVVIRCDTDGVVLDYPGIARRLR